MMPKLFVRDFIKFDLRAQVHFGKKQKVAVCGKTANADEEGLRGPCLGSVHLAYEIFMYPTVNNVAIPFTASFSASVQIIGISYA